MEKLSEQAERLHFSLGIYLDGIEKLNESGIFRILRELGRVEVVSPSTPNYEAYQNALANFSAGFNKALDCVSNFKKMLDSEKPAYKPAVDFGGLSRAVENGSITEDEANGFRAEQQFGDAGK